MAAVAARFCLAVVRVRAQRGSLSAAQQLKGQETVFTTTKRTRRKARREPTQQQTENEHLEAVLRHVVCN